MKTAIITGANGFIGSYLTYHLLGSGWRVHALGRSKGSANWTERVNAALQQVGDSPQTGRLTCVETDLCVSRLEPPVACSDAFLFHVAGDTRFAPANSEAQRQMNVQTAVALLNTLKKNISRAVHVSTAYVAGDRTGIIREDELDAGQGFHNSYEKSKFDAELAVGAFCRAEGIPLVIVRPAIIINDRQTGRASTFTHLNALVEVVSRIQDHFGLHDGQVVSRTIRLLVDPHASPNLAAIDSIIFPLLRIALAEPSPGQAFHLCHPSPQSNAEIVELILAAFGIHEQVALEYVEDLSAPMSYTEEMILRSLRVYSPYLNSRCQFDLSRSRAVVPDYDQSFSKLDVDYLRKVIAFQRHQREHRP